MFFREREREREREWGEVGHVNFLVFLEKRRELSFFQIYSSSLYSKGIR